MVRLSSEMRVRRCEGRLNMGTYGRRGNELSFSLSFLACLGKASISQDSYHHEGMGEEKHKK